MKLKTLTLSCAFLLAAAVPLASQAGVHQNPQPEALAVTTKPHLKAGVKKHKPAKKHGKSKKKGAKKPRKSAAQQATH
ncbi:MAG: hypothetical protein JO006_03580 [Paucibacter sp.]|nr:hypothetical protein [Roseateles sp.]